MPVEIGRLVVQASFGAAPQRGRRADIETAASRGLRAASSCARSRTACAELERRARER